MFNFFGGRSKKSLMEAVKEAKQNQAVRLVDVRSPEEYRQGHVPGAINLPLDRLDNAARLLPDKGFTLYLYCHSGARSAMAVGALKRLGYADCSNVGGVGGYAGALEK